MKMESLNESIQKKWQPVLEHPDLAPIKDVHKRSVVAQLLENQQRSGREAATLLHHCSAKPHPSTQWALLLQQRAMALSTRSTQF
jgi:hypothetical protein